MADYDLIVRNGLVVDGTGLPRRRVDVGIRDGRIARLAHLADATAEREIDADGAIVAPGIVDAHTHYDPQITFDPYATTSCFHGVTTVLAGNCGFSVAPCRPQDREFLTGIFAAVENMDPIALSAITWDEFESFGDSKAFTLTYVMNLKGAVGPAFAQPMASIARARPDGLIYDLRDYFDFPTSLVSPSRIFTGMYQGFAKLFL